MGDFDYSGLEDEDQDQGGQGFEGEGQEGLEGGAVEGAAYGFPAEMAEQVAAFDTYAEEIGLTPEQRENLATWYRETFGKELAPPSYEDAVEVLRQEWGGRTDENLGVVAATFNTFAEHDPDIKALGDDLKIALHPGMAKLLFSIGQMLDLKPTAASSSGRPAGRDIDRQIAEVEADAALYDARDPRHAEVLAQRDKLYKKKYGS